MATTDIGHNFIILLELNEELNSLSATSVAETNIIFMAASKAAIAENFICVNKKCSKSTVSLSRDNKYYLHCSVYNAGGEGVCMEYQDVSYGTCHYGL